MPMLIVQSHRQAAAVNDKLAAFKNKRVRVTIRGRKMTVPGKLVVKDQKPTLVTNWGLELDLSDVAKNKVTRIETKDPDTGWFVGIDL